VICANQRSEEEEKKTQEESDVMCTALARSRDPRLRTNPVITTSGYIEQ
jgi:hypothetical protein